VTDGIEAIIPVRLAVSENAFVDWLFTPVADRRLVYHRGFLARDTDPDQSRMKEPDRLELLHVARRAMSGSDKGALCLVQKKHGFEDYSYIAVRRTPDPKNAARKPL
jgi:hypothetical protein